MSLRQPRLSPQPSRASRFHRSILGVLSLMVVFPGISQAGGPLPRYTDDVAFLRKHTQVIELKSNEGEPGVVAVCPKWQGRVMTSTFEPEFGPSLGWVNRPFIEAGKNDKVFNNYGGAERFWLSPEAGQFALFFEPGKPQTLANWRTPEAMNEVEFKLDSAMFAGVRYGAWMSADMELTNYAGTKFKLSIGRGVQFAGSKSFGRLFGAHALSLVEEGRGQLTGFQIETQVTPETPMRKESGLASIWSLGQFQPGPSNVIVLPHRVGSESELGPVVTTRYFGEIPANRLRDLGNALLFRGDAQYRSKIGLSPRRSKGIAGAMNFDAEVLTLVTSAVALSSDDDVYLNNLWDVPQKDPFQGDSINSYNDGPTAPGEASLGGFFELETLSPTRELKAKEPFAYRNWTYHIKADLPTLNRISKEVLGVGLDQMQAFLGP